AIGAGEGAVELAGGEVLGDAADADALEDARPGGVEVPVRDVVVERAALAVDEVALRRRAHRLEVRRDAADRPAGPRRAHEAVDGAGLRDDLRTGRVDVRLRVSR